MPKPRNYLVDTTIVAQQIPERQPLETAGTASRKTTAPDLTAELLREVAVQEGDQQSLRAIVLPVVLDP